MRKKATGKGRGKGTGSGSRPDPASDQTPGKTPAEKARGPTPPDRVASSPTAGIGRLPDPTPGPPEQPHVARPDWPPPFRGSPPGPPGDPGLAGGGVRSDPGAQPEEVGEDLGAERGSVKGGPSGGGVRHSARQGGEGRDTQDRTDLAGGGPGTWKNPGQGSGNPAGPGRSSGNQPDVKAGDEVAGPDLPPGRSPAAGRQAGGLRVAREEERPEREPEQEES